MALKAPVQGELALEQALVLLPVSLAKLDCAVTVIELLITNRKRRRSKGLGLHMEYYPSEGSRINPGQKVDRHFSKQL
jgi:hypothetical protein